MIEQLTRPEVQAFLKAHTTADPASVALLKNRPGGIDASLLASQLKARQKAKEKLPSWYNRGGIVFPHGVAMEQCSSEVTARWKAGRWSGASFADLTGGTGVDTWCFAQSFQSGIYVESEQQRCDLAAHNFGVLGATNIKVSHGSAESFLAASPSPFDLLYLDPDRRAGGQRVVGFADSRPNVAALMPELVKRASTVVIKASPMIDIQQGMKELGYVNSVVVLAVNNECKEVLFVCSGENSPVTTEAVHLHGGREDRLAFTTEGEAAMQVSFCAPLAYFYDANVALLKAGAYKTVASVYGLQKLHPNTHLYTSAELVSDFPGRVFRVVEVLPFSSHLAKSGSLPFKKAHVMAKNFPLAAAELQKKLSLKEGEEGYVIGTTVLSGEKVVVVAQRVG